MRILQSIFIISILLFASNQCNAAIYDSFPFEINDHPPCTEQTDLDDSYGPVNLISFFQRTEQVTYYHPSGKEFSGELFFRFGKMESASVGLIPYFLFCTPIGITLIFPKHYFF